MRLDENIKLIIISAILAAASFLFLSCTTKIDDITLFSSEGVISIQPSISHDGHYVSFTTVFPDGHSEVNIIDLEKRSHQSVSVDGYVLGPISWSADDTSIYFISSIMGNDLRIKNMLEEVVLAANKRVTVSKEYERKLFGPPLSKGENFIFMELLEDVKWSDKIKFFKSNLWFFDKNSGRMKTIQEGVLSPIYNWTADGRISFMKGRKDNDRVLWDLYLMNVNTGDIKLLIKAVAEVHILRNNHIYCFKKKNKKYEIIRISLENYMSTSIGFIDKLFEPAISFDEKKMAFLRDNQIWLVNLESMDEIKLTNSKVVKKYLLWTKNENYLIYSTINDLIEIKAK